MSISKRAKIIFGAIALTGAVAATGGAFTAGGLVREPDATVFVGGEVSQTIEGATLESIDYDYTDASNSSVNEVTLTFSAEIAKDVDIRLNNSGADVLDDCAAGTDADTIPDSGDEANVYTCDGFSVSALSQLDVVVDATITGNALAS